MKRIGILTSGGDAPGMNACIRAAVRTALAHDLAIVGIRRGYTGLIAGDSVPLDRSAIRNIIHLGGTILETSRNPDFYTKEGRLRAAESIGQMELDGIVLIGGEGTFHGANLLGAETDPAALVGVPGSIDNDVYGTDYCIGFDTAANCAVEAIDRIRDTARSHERLSFIEVMGGRPGFSRSRAASPAAPRNWSSRRKNSRSPGSASAYAQDSPSGSRARSWWWRKGKTPGISFEIAREVGEHLNFEARVVVLGHLQRGGPPTLRDRGLGSLLGAAAIEALLEGRSGCMVSEVGGDLACTPLEETWQKKKPLNENLRRIFTFLSK